MELKLYTIDTAYVDYLQNACGIQKVLDNKEDSTHERPYLGIVLQINAYKYYVPLSSPKNSDYFYVNGIRTIRRDIVPIIRIITENEDGEVELKGKLKFSNMIPVPDNVITYYNISQENNENYKILVEKEYEFILSNQDKIRRNAQILYNQKTKEDILYSDENANKKPGYLNATIDFKYAEQMHDKYIAEDKQ
nr:type III toxin-antitoxin system ToxN/AbiQ family toxin [uncultured Blautia sp.]